MGWNFASILVEVSLTSLRFEVLYSWFEESWFGNAERIV